MIESNMEKLTSKEEQIMQVLWTLEHAFVNDIKAALPDPKPHYNTISTVIKRLQKKGYVGFDAFGPTHRYYPSISKAAYKSAFLGEVLDGFFDKSYKNLVAHFAKEEKITADDLKEILKMIEGEKD